MNAPRWFYPLVAACLVPLTVAGVRWTTTAGRFVAIEKPDMPLAVLDTHTGIVCIGNAAGTRCMDLSSAGNMLSPEKGP